KLSSSSGRGGKQDQHPPGHRGRTHRQYVDRRRREARRDGSGGGADQGQGWRPGESEAVRCSGECCESGRVSMSKFFINRPIVAIVISIVTVIVGAITVASLPISLFPQIAPPEVQVQTTYVGADAQTVEQSVATPIEQQISGVDNLNYMYSVNSSTGDLRLIV